MRGNKALAGLLKEAALTGTDVVVPPVVITETLRGSGKDTRIFQLLQQGAVVPSTDLRVARRAGELLGETDGSNAPDAQVAAHCLDVAPATLVTSDARDMRVLLQEAAGIRIYAI